MPDMTMVSFELENDLKEKADTLFEALGMSFATAFKIFVRQTVREQALPFRPSFYSADINVDEQSLALFDNMREETAVKHGYMTDDEIDTVIAAVRAEKKARG